MLTFQWRIWHYESIDLLQQLDEAFKQLASWAFVAFLAARTLIFCKLVLKKLCWCFYEYLGWFYHIPFWFWYQCWWCHSAKLFLFSLLNIIHFFTICFIVFPGFESIWNHSKHWRMFQNIFTKFRKLSLFLCHVKHFEFATMPILR